MKKTKIKEPTHAELKDAATLFSTEPNVAYKNVVHNNYYSYGIFWDEFKPIYTHLPDELSDEGRFYVIKASGLFRFYHLDTLYQKEISNLTERLLGLNPAYNIVLKSLFLIMDLGDDKSPIIDVGYSRGNVESVKKILKIVSSKPNKSKAEGYSLELFNTCLLLLRAYSERFQMLEMLDLYIRDEFMLLPSESGEGYNLTLINEKSKIENLYILNDLKTKVKRSYKKNESQSQVSERDHFKKHDTEESSSKDLVVAFHGSNSKITSSTPGTKAKQIDDEIFNLIFSTDPVKQQEGMLKAQLILHEDTFHYNFRQVLAEIYQPNDEIDIDELHIKVDENQYLTLFELLAAVGGLVSFSDVFRYYSPMFGVSNIRRKLSSAIAQNEPELNQEEVYKKCDSIIATQFEEIEKRDKEKLFIYLSKEQLLGIFKKVEELQSKTQKQLEKIIEILSGFNTPIPYNILYATEGKYYFSHKTCTSQSVVRDIYDYFITDRLFNSIRKTPEERKIIDEIQKGRELRFRRTLNNHFNKLTRYTSIEMDFPDKEKKYDFGELAGDTDMVAYFEEENLLIAIQVKLSNRPSFSEKRKLKWIEDKLEKDAARQVLKDDVLYSREVGLKFLADKTGYEGKIPLDTLRFYPLIVTDNFFADHDTFEYSDAGDVVLCVSSFEVENLINGVKIHENQDAWESVTDKKSGLYLIDLMEENRFWNFLAEFAQNYSDLKSLKLVEAVDNIHLRI